MPLTHRALYLRALVIVMILDGCRSVPPLENDDWTTYLGGPDSNHYSPLAQIHRDNVTELEPAWIFRTGDADPENRSQIQCNPLVIDGVLYGTSPGLKLFALDAKSGALLWQFDPFEGDYRLHGIGVNRGVAYWEAGEDKRILYTAGPELFAVDASTGAAIQSFGVGGRVDLHLGLTGSDDDASELFVGSNTPGVIYENLLILGHRASEALPAIRGDIRAFDVRTGALVWSFHTIPHPGEPGAETWPEGAWKRSGGANAWAGMSLDRERGVVYVPTGSAAYDFYGADRPGENLFANSVLALDAATGNRKWHYQVVHHDIWDRDLPAPPNLVTVEQDGRKIAALAQITKSGYVFLLDRDSGEPLFPVEERAVPASDLPGESTSPTQPFPTKPPPFSRQQLTSDNLTDISAVKKAWGLERLRRLRPSQPFLPPSREGTIILPGYDGGGEWGGAAVDPDSAVLYVNASEMPWILTMVEVQEGEVPRLADFGRLVYAQHCLYCHGVDLEGDPEGVVPAIDEASWSETDLRRLLEEGKGFMPSFEFLAAQEVEDLVAFLLKSTAPAPETRRGPTRPLRYTSTGYHRFLDDDGYPAIAPPWGTLTAIDLNEGEILWQVTLGELEELTRDRIAPTGTENYGGPIVTAGGLIFIAATKDEKFRAFDNETGELLWETKLPAGGYATPATYAVDGRQYVVVAAGGGKMGTPSGDAYIAFALPER